jgi:nucleotide-binding universal stress UspA family protein
MNSSSEKAILIPVGSSDNGIIAVKQSYELARLTKAKLVLLAISTGNHPYKEKVFNKIVAEARANSGVEVDTMVRSGNPYHEIEKVADVLNPLFIVMRLTQSLSPDKLIGRNAFKMVRQSKHAVITVKGDATKDGCDVILLPLDLSKESREKVDRAIDLAKMFKAVIKIVAVTNDKKEEAKLAQYMKQAEKIIHDFKVECTTEIIHGSNVPNNILKYAKEVHADLIVIMTQEKINISDMLIWNMGTVAQQLINKSEVPVLSFRPSEKKDTTSMVKPY